MLLTISTDDRARPSTGRPPWARRLGGQRWGLAALAITLVALSTMFTEFKQAHDPGNSDGHYNWIFARSLAYDGDLDFANDYALCGDPFGIGRDYGTGRPVNSYYIGPALLWAPVAFAARYLVTLPANASPSQVAGCEGPRAEWAMRSTMLAAVGVFWLLYRLARRFAGDGVATMAALLTFWTSPLPNYASVQSSYGHVHEALAASLALLLAVRANASRGRLLPWFAAGVAIGLAILQKPPLVLLAVVPGALLLALLRERLVTPWRAVACAALLGAGLLAFGLVPLLAINRYLFGAYTISGAKAPMYVQFGHAHPWLLLFAPRGGLFFWMPPAWLCVFGLLRALRVRETRPLAWASLALCASLVYLNAAVIDWDASSSVGARRLSALVPVLAFAAAMALERARRWLSVGRRMQTALGVAVTVPLVWTFGGITASVGLGRTSLDKAHSQEELYGGGAGGAWAMMDKKVGDLAVLPASLLYAWRYGLPARSFRDGTTARGYDRDFRNLTPPTPLPSPMEQLTAGLTRGAAAEGGGVRLDSRAAVLFTVRWPYATEIRIEARADRPVELWVGQGRAFRSPLWIGHVSLSPGGPQSWTAAVPPDAWDSGINELVFEHSDAQAQVILRDVRLRDDGAYAAVPGR